MRVLRRLNWFPAACVLQAAFWIGLAAPAAGDEPGAQPSPPAAAAPTAPQREFTPAEQAQLVEAKKLIARVVALSGAGKYGEAIPPAQRVVTIARQVLGEKHPDYAQSLNNLAGLYEAQGNYAKAEPLYVEALAIDKQALGEKHPVYAVVLTGLALLYKDEGNYAKAEPLYVKALAINKQALGEKHPVYATDLNNLASLYEAQGNYAKAEPLYVKALAICKQVLGEKHPYYAASLNNLASLYEAQGNYAKAEPLYVEALAICKQVFGEKHPAYALSLNNLAMLYQAQGNYAKAEPLYVEALAVCKQVLGDKHPAYAASLNNLASLYRAAGDYAKAEPLYVEALAIRKQALGEKHPDYAESLNNLASLYEAQGNYAKAEPLYVEALAIDKQALGDKHPVYATDLNNLADLYEAQGNYAKAEPLFVEALAIHKQALGDKHPAYATGLNNLAMLYDNQGNYAKAEPLYVEALAVCKQVLGEKHPDYATSLNNLAACEIGLRSPRSASDAASHARLAAEIMRRQLEQTAAVQSEHQQLLMADNLRHAFHIFLSAGRAAGTPPEAVYDEVLAWKGAVTSRQALLRSLRPALAKNPQAAALFGRLEAVTSELAVQSNRVPTGPQLATYKKRLDELGAEVEDLQAKLANLSAPFAERRAQQQRTSAELRHALPADTALVDLIECPIYGWTQGNKQKLIWESRVAAFVVRPDRPVTWIDLGPSADIDGAVEAWRTGFGRGEKSEQAAATLRQRVWQPLEASLAGATTVLISPDGELAKLPWNALPGTKPGTYLIEERAIAVIPVPQALPELLAKSAAPNSAPSLLLVGDVDYGGDPGVLLASNQGQRAIRDGATKWNPLPGTRAEILAIRDSFEEKFPKGKVKPLRKEQATAEAVCEAAPNYRYLHFATHGFFADAKLRSVLAPSDKPGSSFDRVTMLRQATGEHPGLLSGIVLTGANQPPIEGKGDGILTALEVGQLDLSGVDLATLSACETGLGKTAGGEGVLGLQRAFQIAGARTTVTSLWKIPDAATRSLMIDFYENLWTKKMSKIEALRQAQLTLMREGVKRGLELPSEQPADAEHRLPPYYWAAFVLSGDWR